MVRIDFNRLRFLVIDDNAHMRRILRTLLHGFGAREVYEAEDGAAGLGAAQQRIDTNSILSVPNRHNRGAIGIFHRIPLMSCVCRRLVTTSASVPH